MRLMPRVRAGAAAFSVMAALAITGCGSDDSGDVAATTSPRTERPTIVLVHGSFSDHTSWDAVAKQLRDRGYEVVQPDNPLRGPQQDAAAITTKIGQIQGPLVLVGHSYGGAVISNIHDPDITAEVFISAFAPQQGESVRELSDPQRFPGSRVESALRIEPSGDGPPEITLAPEQYGTVFAQDLSAAQAAQLAARQQSTSAAANAAPSGAPSWATVPSWYLISTHDRVLPPATQRFQADRMKARVHEVASSHAVPVAHPDAVVDIIVQAAAG